MSTAPATGPSTRDRILDAALAAFAERGVEATSLDFVAAEVGVRKQTLLYWFPSKEQLLLSVVDHAVAELGRVLSHAAFAGGPDLAGRITAVVDATFRLGSIRPELLAVVREVTRLGPPASTHLAHAADPLVATASSVLSRSGHVDEDHVRRVLLAAGARVIGIATEAEVREDLGLPADLPWLRERRRALLDWLVAALA
ncbi:TetR/AcrR family transcriptional regulator [Aquihabitans daechungensis]|uniref:TetR/AcrR family transcriptional regulator n=1 Tax=Aquihabitans daechungensis TaxID=1052257 RepID=UPI003BA31023